MPKMQHTFDDNGATALICLYWGCGSTAEKQLDRLLNGDGTDQDVMAALQRADAQICSYIGGQSPPARLLTIRRVLWEMVQAAAGGSQHRELADAPGGAVGDP